MKSPKKIYECTKCGYQSPGFLGRCPECGSFGTLEEQLSAPPPSASPKIQRRQNVPERARVFSDDDSAEIERIKSGIAELDRVLGGGIVEGSVILLAGEPGIGKSTLLMQLCAHLGVSVMYVSGEESGGQLKLRAKRLGVRGQNLFILTETNIEKILAETDRVKPEVVIVDSIQTIYAAALNSTPGSVTQVKETALSFINKAKGEGMSVIMVGHVNKEGSIAGPKVLEHMVDAVLYFEGERQQSYRIIRAIKNRYGSINEIGVFEMTDRGLIEVENPSEMLLAGRPRNISGNCAVCTLEGTRPLIAEIQALVTQTAFPAPRRTTNGIDYNRMCLIIAVLEKRLGLKFYQNDVYMNVIGGLRLDEPASDLSVALALISSVTDRIIPDDLIALGEVGLAGECRAIANLEVRVREAARLGFTTAVVPYRNVEKRALEIPGIRLIPIKGIYEALGLLRERE